MKKFLLSIVLSMLSFAGSVAQTIITADQFNLSGSKTISGYTVELQKNSGTTAPAYHANTGAIRLYAKGSLTVSGDEISKIVVTLASDAAFRYTTFTPSTGAIEPAQAAGDTEITWVGNASSVTFSVGDFATMGTDGESKPGQIRFTSITIYGEVSYNPIELSIHKVKYFIPDSTRKTDAVAIGVADGNFSLDGLEIANFVSFNGIDYPVTSIADDAFNGITGLTGELKIGENVKTIGDRAFSGCSGFDKVIFSNSLKSIGSSAFYRCKNLTGNLNLPESLTYIGGSAFYDCSGFTGTLNLPESLTDIGSYAFTGCRGLSGPLVIPNSVTSIGTSAFENCSFFTGNLILPELLQSIGSRAFLGCTGFMGALVLPNSLTNIGDRAFYDCSGFTGTLELPDALTTIGDRAFYGCSGFTGSLMIPESVTTIEFSAFCGCEGFNGNLNLPSFITIISSGAFQSTNFEKVICHRLTPPDCDLAAFATARQNELQVPGDAITAYMLKAPWSEFKKIYSLEPLEGIQFAEANVVCPLGGTVRLKVNKTPFGAEGDITFISGNTAVATVDANGVVTGVAKGSTAIVAMSGTLTAICVVTVEDPTIAATALEFEGIIGNVGERVAIGAKVLPANATAPTISWQSSNPEVAAVDQDGSVWFNAAGSATVTAECQGHELSVPFMVREVMARALNVFPVEAVGGVGHEFSLLALHEPENTTDKSVTWESSDPEVATVSEDGRVSLASLGSAKITARSGEHTAVCAVTVDETVGLTEMASTGVVIDVVEGGIVVRNVDAGESIAVYSVDGKVVNGAIAEGEETKLNLAAGIYIVKVSPATVAKVLVK